MLAAVHFLLLHTPGEGEMAINVEEISSIRRVHDFEEKSYGKDVNCIVIMTNGKAIGTSDECKDIIRQIFEMSPRDAPGAPR